MAIKGVPIDLNKKYKMQDGTKITSLILKDENPYSFGHPIRAYWTDKNGIKCSSRYTKDGFFRSDELNVR